MKKLEKLKKILSDMDSVLLAYSGGLDSTFLLKVASGVLGERLLVVTANSPTYPSQELKFARRMASALKVRHRVINTLELKDKKFITNPINRCYFCKRELFRRLKLIARKNRLNFVIDASNLSDKNDFRPGNKAKAELGVRSPLEEAGIGKEEIRILSKNLGIASWDKPSMACLASRIPYGNKISTEILQRIDRAELFLKNLGFRQVRVRHYNGLCRIEVSKKDMPRLVWRQREIIDKLKKLGYNYITLDLEGYRCGSLNEVMKV